MPFSNYRWKFVIKDMKIKSQISFTSRTGSALEGWFSQIGWIFLIPVPFWTVNPTSTANKFSIYSNHYKIPKILRKLSTSNKTKKSRMSNLRIHTVRAWSKVFWIYKPSVCKPILTFSICSTWWSGNHKESWSEFI